MRWDNLFDDLESQLAREVADEEADVRGEQERLRLGGLGLRDRIVALAAGEASATGLRLVLVGGERLSLAPVTIGADWLLARAIDRPGQCLVPLSAVAGVALDAAQVTASLVPRNRATFRPSVPERLGFGIVLRDLCRRRRAVEIVLADTILRGTIDRVGSDHLDIALHEPGTARRDRVVSEYRLVPFAAVLLVRI